MSKETNKTEPTKEELKNQLESEIEVLELELVHSKLIADIQEQSTRRYSLLVQEANIMASRNTNEANEDEVVDDKASD